jgi:hypothetical protein
MATRLPPNFSPFFEGNQLEVGCLDVKPRIRIPQNPEVFEDGLGKGNQGFRDAGTGVWERGRGMCFSWGGLVVRSGL